MKFHSLIFFLFLLCFSPVVNGQGRVQFSINDGWKFFPNGTAYAETVAASDAGWEPVSLPHTWNATDPFDDDKTYRRGISWYRKELNLDARLKDKKVFLYFEAANQVAHLYVNGYFAGMHKGGYTGFAIDITNYLNWKPNGKNLVAVQVSNAHDPFIPPLNVGYASYGGIYRDAWAIVTDKLHFTGVNNNSGGVYITTPGVTKQQATVAVRTQVKNETNAARTFQFVNTITDAAGMLVKSFTKSVTIAANQEMMITNAGEPIANPKLWSPASPYRYQVTSQIVANGVVLDEVRNNIGFRWFSFDNGNGFSLNGEKLLLHGTNRHQDIKGKGDALTAEDHRRDMQLIKDMGCNFVRLAHYPQAAEVLRLADELGLLIWEETPVVNFVTNSPEFVANEENMIHEMITQGYNHPAVIMWGSSNEILLHGPDGERIGTQNDPGYMAVVKNFAMKFDSTVRAEDPTRYSTVAMHVSGDYAKYGLDTISQVAGYNVYSGWYSGKVEEFGTDLDKWRKPGHNVFISEYGAEGEVRLNTNNPMRFDYTGQYQRYFNESYLRQINERPWLAGTAIWNQFDFSQPNIGGPQSHRNQKGMATWDRKNKDVYYLYKANWNPEPMVYIATRDWLVRSGESQTMTTFEAYSNAPELTLTVNGVAQKIQRGNDVKKFSWQVLLKDGANELSASGKINGQTYSDHVVINYKAFNADLSGIQSLSVNVGSNAQYLDASGNVWVEDRPYRKGSFGSVSGSSKMFDRKDVIMSTADEPVFYTYQDSLPAYRFDVPDGQYQVTLRFAEPFRIKTGDRVFNVTINGVPALRDFDIAAAIGIQRAVNKSFIAQAVTGNGLTIQFEAIKGNAILNAIKIRRL
ncbi:MAG: glycoside hydrolase family 2 TIM barrel-domain containing protein [Chitinophagaceae bacterium]